MRLSFFSILLALLMLLLAIKAGDSTGGVEISDYYIEIATTPAVALVRASALYVATAVLALLLILSRNHIQLENNGAATLFTVGVVFYLIRSSFYDGQLTLKHQLAIVYVFGLYVLASTIRAICEKSEGALMDLHSAFVLFAMLFVGVNAIYMIFGFGYATEGTANRYFGLTDHPNFLGANSAVTTTIAATTLLTQSNSKRSFIFFLIILLCSLVLVVSSGSRTGTLMTLGGCTFAAVQAWRYRYISARSLLYIATAVAMLAVTYWVNNPQSPEYTERLSSTENTRAEAWAAMVNVFLGSPLFGGGYSPNSENSLLKAMSAAGLLVGIPLLYSMISSALGAARAPSGPATLNHTRHVMLPSLIISILIGSFFEGFLIEFGGLMALIYLFSTSLLK